MRIRKDKQVFVDYRDQVTATSPMEKRTYTMTHSDETGDLFVTIGLSLATDMTNSLRDEVYLTWTKFHDKPLLYGEVLIDGEGITNSAKIRNDIFRREMPLALKAIYIADTPFFNAHSDLNITPILINFKSSDPTYNKLYSYGAIGDYSNSTI